MDPIKSIDAIISPSGISLGQLALLQKIGSPLYCGDSGKIKDLAPGLMIFGLEPDIAIALVESGEFEEVSASWIEEVGREKIVSLLDVISVNIARFWDLLPAPDPEQKPRPGNGLIAELAEWYARTYHVEPVDVIWKEPAVRIALFFRVWSQSVGGNKASTLGQELVNAEDFEALQELCKTDEGERNGE